MVAGPNGSGKTTLIETNLPESIRGAYVNADDIEKEVRATGFFDLEAFGLEGSDSDFEREFRGSDFLRSAGLSGEVSRVGFENGQADFRNVPMNAYFASVLAAAVRRRLVLAKRSLTFETVMSSYDKVEFLEGARKVGFRNYLYYVATEDPAINVSRVKNRVALGGHPVPEEKIAKRYHRSLKLLAEAIQRTDRAYIFDNSGPEGGHTWVAEVTNGSDLEMRTSQVPDWFQRSVLER